MSAAEKTLRVGIDISSIPFGRGVSRYTSNVVKALAAQPGVTLTLFGAVGKDWSRLKSWASDLRGRPPFRVLPVPSTWLDKAWSWLAFLGTGHFAPDAEVIHAWEWQVPPQSEKPWVVTVHDLAHLLFPETAHPEVVRRYKSLLERVERDPLAHVIAVSNSTKNDIVRLTSIAPERITVILEALPEEAKYVPSEAEVSHTLQHLDLKKPYFLFVGTSEPRKNLQRVIQAWQAAGSGYELVLAGAKGWDNLPHVPGLRELGYVEPNQLSSLYRGATALLFPSLYEGFGLPVLEAFFHDCPVITSRVSSLPEVAGEAAILVDPYAVESIAEGITQLLESTPAQKSARQKKMAQQVSKFSWDTAAEQMIQVYRKAARG
jgi:glycosyltransferase involved in cell wall biosynthesis